MKKLFKKIYVYFKEAIAQKTVNPTIPPPPPPKETTDDE